MATERQALLVLGMHRSGTSALTRVLNIYGAALPSDLLPANAGNVTGYWESSAVVRINDEMLEALGSPWDDPLWFSVAPLSADTTRERAGQVADLIVAEFGDAPLVVVKDPRLCRLLPIWREGLALLSMQPLPILLLRNPLEAASSMHQRDGMPEGAALLLWLQYTLAAEHASRSLQRSIVFYDELLADCPRVVDRIQSQLGVIFPARSPATDAEAAAFVRPALRHERASAASVQTRGDISRWVRTVYAWFERARSTDVPPDTRDLDAVRSEVAEVEMSFGPSLRWRVLNEQQRATHDEAVRWKAHVSATDAVWGERIRQLESRLVAAGEADAVWRDQTARLESSLSACREQAADLETRLTAAAAVLREQIGGLTERLAAVAARESALREHVQRVESQLATLGAAHSALGADRAALASAHAAISARLQRIEATLAWRVWRRIRTVQRRLSGGVR